MVTGVQAQQNLSRTTSFLKDRNNFEALSRGDDKITRADLQQASTDRALTDEQRATAARLLDSPTFMNALDVGAGRGEVDGRISYDDVEGLDALVREQGWSGPTIGVDGAISSRDEAEAVLDRYELLADTAGGKGGRNGHVSNEDLRAIIDDPQAPAELRQAAQFLETGGIELPGNGSLWGTITSPARGVADWTTDRIGDGASAAGDLGRGALSDPVTLTSEQRGELEAAAADAEGLRPDLLLNEQHNAHLTNTPEEMLEALEGDYQWLEGDVRRDPPVMGHDWADAGLTLDDWLEIGGASGKGLKLDIKEGDSVDGVIDAVRAAGIADERLIFNADVFAGPGGSGRNVAPEDLERLREAFPGATVAIGAKTGSQPEGTTYSEEDVSEMIAIAERVGGDVMFPLRAEFVTPEIVERLSEHGDVAIWNSPSTTHLQTQQDVDAEAERFREMGVTGLIDLRTAKQS